MNENFSLTSVQMQTAVTAIAALFMPLIQAAVKDAVADVIAEQQREHDSRTYTRQEVAGLLTITLPTLDKLATNGKLTPIRIGRRVVFSAKEVDAIVASGKSVKYTRKG